MSEPSSPRIPFPGMDPYLEHPALWPSVHVRMVVWLANQLGPLIRPRYIASIEDRVFMEKPKLEGREHYIEVLDRYHDLKVTTVIEMVSPPNKAAGPSRDAYLARQDEVLSSECHLVEIDLLRRGRHVLSCPLPWVNRIGVFDYLICVNRWPQRKRFKLYPCRLRERLPCIPLPLTEPDGDVPLDIQAALEQIYENGSYMLRVLYDQPCDPPLDDADQQWATERWQAFKTARPDLFPRGDA